MDAKAILSTMVTQTKTGMKNIEDESARIQQQIAELQQRLNALAEQHFMLRGKEQAYNEALTVLEQIEVAPPAGEAAE